MSLTSDLVGPYPGLLEQRMTATGFETGASSHELESQPCQPSSGLIRDAREHIESLS